MWSRSPLTASAATSAALAPPRSSSAQPARAGTPSLVVQLVGTLTAPGRGPRPGRLGSASPRNRWRPGRRAAPRRGRLRAAPSASTAQVHRVRRKSPASAGSPVLDAAPAGATPTAAVEHRRGARGGCAATRRGGRGHRRPIFEDPRRHGGRRAGGRLSGPRSRAEEPGRCDSSTGRNRRPRPSSRTSPPWRSVRHRSNEPGWPRSRPGPPPGAPGRRPTRSTSPGTARRGPRRAPSAKTVWVAVTPEPQ